MERKNMFTINFDDDTNAIENQSLILRRESAALAQKRKELDKDFEKAIHKSINKGIGKMLLRLLSPFAMLGLGGILLSFGPQMFVLKAVAIILMLAGVALLVVNYKKDKAEEIDEDEDEPDEALDSVDVFNEQVKQELRVPSDATEVEVFTTMHSAQRDKKAAFAYTNDTPLAFVEDGKLCFWYNGAVIGFPMSEIEALVKVNDPITFDSWMADDPYDGLKYAKYGIEMEEVDQIEEHYTMKGYYSLRFTHEGEPFELLFPLFDAEKLLELIDREIIEE